MTAHYAIGYFLVLSIPIVASIFVFSSIKKSANWLIGLAAALVALVASFALTAASVVNCSDSIDTRMAAPKLLTPEELETLSGFRFICPTVYTFQRNGEKECLVSNRDGGAFVGCG